MSTTVQRVRPALRVLVIVGVVAWLLGGAFTASGLGGCASYLWQEDARKALLLNAFLLVGGAGVAVLLVGLARMFARDDRVARTALPVVTAALAACAWGPVPLFLNEVVINGSAEGCMPSLHPATIIYAGCGILVAGIWMAYSFCWMIWRAASGRVG
jgi:hypothetical protein